MYVCESTSWHIHIGKEGSCSHGIHWSEVRECCQWLFTSRFCSHLPPSWAKDQAGLLWKNTAFHCMCVCGRKSVVEKLMFVKSQGFITLTFLQGQFFCVQFPHGKQHPSSQAQEYLPWPSPCFSASVLCFCFPPLCFPLPSVPSICSAVCGAGVQAVWYPSIPKRGHWFAVGCFGSVLEGSCGKLKWAGGREVRKGMRGSKRYSFLVLYLQTKLG